MGLIGGGHLTQFPRGARWTREEGTASPDDEADREVLA